MIFKQNKFTQGLDRNFDKDFGQVDRLHTLQNAPEWYELGRFIRYYCVIGQRVGAQS